MHQGDLHIHEAVRILELTDPPYAMRAIEQARRRLAKQWHPDHAPPEQRGVHERHMVDVNRAADLLLARARELGGKLTAIHVRVSEQAAQARAREAADRAEAAAAAAEGPRTTRRARAPERSVVHSYARSHTHPEWGVGTVVNLFTTGAGDDVRRWAQVTFDGRETRTMRYENLEFVDFKRPDPGRDRAKRFLAAARKARAAGDHELAVKRLLYARNANPDEPRVLHLLALELLHVRDTAAAARTTRSWVRAEPRSPAPCRLLAEIYRAMGAWELALEADAEAEKRERAQPRRRVPSGKRRRRRASRAA